MKSTVLLIDGMALVNSMSKNDNIRTCSDFANLFCERLINISIDYNEVRLIFDRYISSSLKEQMRNKRTKGKSVYYHINDSTVIKNISLKDLLSNIKTKAELAQYLAIKALDHSKSSEN